MLKKILDSLLSKNNKHKHGSSSGYKRGKFGQHPSKQGHHYYKKKHRSSGSRSYSS
ncbi:hypothetical protein J9317_10920 [Metabacillus sp. KIGAM252]|uniref:Uncharacterized protein n=1 Tax=Metabacillus flavus TaxID=2823519 RepID=A0ABS5LF91_9BACI|nr:hypothetical protein [Metabacillus flavus]MBS2969276.1 hypothetical protein [Metabacillus flavus]